MPLPRANVFASRRRKTLLKSGYLYWLNTLDFVSDLQDEFCLGWVYVVGGVLPRVTAEQCNVSHQSLRCPPLYPLLALHLHPFAHTTVESDTWIHEPVQAYSCVCLYVLQVLRHCLPAHRNGSKLPTNILPKCHLRSDKFLADVPREHVRTFVSADPSEQVRSCLILFVQR